MEIFIPVFSMKEIVLKVNSDAGSWLKIECLLFYLCFSLLILCTKYVATYMYVQYITVLVVASYTFVIINHIKDVKSYVPGIQACGVHQALNCFFS